MTNTLKKSTKSVKKTINTTNKMIDKNISKFLTIKPTPVTAPVTTPVTNISKTANEDPPSPNKFSELMTIKPTPIDESENSFIETQPETQSQTQPETQTQPKTPPQTPPVIAGEIKTEGGYVIVRLSNPHYGKEGDLIPFYSPDYFNLMQIPHPDIFINDDNNNNNNNNDDNATTTTTTMTQKGGENESTNKNTEDSITTPYKYFKYAMDNNPIALIKKTIPKMTFKTENPNIVKTSMPSPPPPPTQTNLTQNKITSSILSITPSRPQNIQGTLLPPTQLFNATPESIYPTSAQTTDTTNHSIILKFHTTNIQSFADISKKRNPEKDVYVTPQGLTYKEIEKIMYIKNKKLFETVSFNELFYMDDTFVILKGMEGCGLHNVDTNTIIQLNDYIALFPNTKINKYPFVAMYEK